MGRYGRNRHHHRPDEPFTNLCWTCRLAMTFLMKRMKTKKIRNDGYGGNKMYCICRVVGMISSVRRVPRRQARRGPGCSRRRGWRRGSSGRGSRRRGARRRGTGLQRPAQDRHARGPAGRPARHRRRSGPEACSARHRGADPAAPHPPPPQELTRSAACGRRSRRRRTALLPR